MGIVNPSHGVAINYTEKDEYRIAIVRLKFYRTHGGQCCFENFVPITREMEIHDCFGIV